MTIEKLEIPEEFDLPTSTERRQRRALEEMAHQPRRRRHRRVAVALAVISAALLVPPTFAVVRTIADVVYPESLPPQNVHPKEAQARTGQRPTIHNPTTYGGQTLAVQKYNSGDGRLCVGEWWGPDAYGTYCVPPARLFANGPVGVFGPVTMQIEGGSDDPAQWDRMYLFGVARPQVARVTVVMTNCDEREAMLDAAGVFLFTVPTSDLYADNWAYRIRGYDRGGNVTFDETLHTIRPTDAPAPEAAPACK